MSFSQMLSILILFIVGFFPNLTNTNFPTWVVVILLLIALLLFVIPVLKDIKRIGQSIKEHKLKVSDVATYPDHQEFLTLKSDYRKAFLFLVLCVIFFIAVIIIISHLNAKSEELNVQIYQMKHSQKQP
ncbi:MAG: hypothetical protein ACD_46C00070G0001 [uncultured bacterium]|nr:MAG: hypothetical protein ACD_46C00070G0001 [uncultured bacterium]